MSKFFFGNRCQYYAKGLDATLDEIFGYEIKFQTHMFHQPYSVRIPFYATLIMYLIGLIDGLCSILTFSRKKPREVGCDIYLWASSLSSLIAVIYQHIMRHKWIVQVNCLYIESALKMIVYIDHWYNVFGAIEPSLCVYQGVTCNKVRSKYVAKASVLVIPYVSL